MIPEKGTIGNIPYDCRTKVEKPTFGYKDRNHFMYTQDRARCNVTFENDMRTSGKVLSPAMDRSGEAVFLPWVENRIASVRLSAPMPSSNVQFFYTATMHGCMLFIDTIPGSKDVIVYHANAKAQDPGGGQLPNSQLPGCVRELKDKHRKAQIDYSIRGLKTIVEFDKQRYFAPANPIVAQKQVRVDRRKRRWNLGIRDRDIRWAGRCFVCGYPAWGEWKFYYQTWGMVKYRRPKGASNVFKGLISGHWKYLYKLGTRGSEEIISEMGVIDSGRLAL